MREDGGGGAFATNAKFDSGGCRLGAGATECPVLASDEIRAEL